MQESIENMLYRITSLEKSLGAVTKQVNTQTGAIQTTNEQLSRSPIAPGQTNFIVNGDFDFTRQSYLYDTPQAADVAEEAYNWFTASPDTAIEGTGSIAAGDNTLTLNTSDFVADDAGKEIVIEGDSGNLITTIASYTDAAQVELTDAAAETITSGRVRWRLRALKEDSTDQDVDANPATNTTLKTSAHSLYGSTVNDPDYDKTNGWARTGATNWLAAPLPKNFFKAGTVYTATFIYHLREPVGGENNKQITPVIGIWDNSPGRRQFLEGKPISVTAETIGSPVSTVSREYFIVFYTNWGEKIGSQKVTVADAPADGSFVTNQVYVNLSWRQPRGAIRTEIYRRTGADYKLIGFPNQGGFRDTNGTGNVPQEIQATVSGYPAVDYYRPQAIIKTTARNFSAAETGRWQQAQVSIAVPFDYDRSGLTDKQWLVIYLTESVAAHAIEIDKVSIDDKYGIFSLSSLDQAAKGEIVTAPISGDQGNPGGIYIPPGETGCPTFEMLIEVEDEGVISQVPAIELVNNKGYKIINRKNEAVNFTARVSREKQVIYELAAEDKLLRASETHPVFINQADTQGKVLRDILSGDTILTKNGVSVVLSNLRQITKEYTVQFELEGEEKGFWINGTGGHNMKDMYREYIPY